MISKLKAKFKELIARVRAMLPSSSKPVSLFGVPVTATILSGFVPYVAAAVVTAGLVWHFMAVREARNEGELAGRFVATKQCRLDAFKEVEQAKKEARAEADRDAAQLQSARAVDQAKLADAQKQLAALQAVLVEDKKAKAKTGKKCDVCWSTKVVKAIR